MKKLLLSLILITVSVFLFAQTPNQFKYQAVLRNTDGTIMAEENVTIVISILKSDLTASVFNETHNISTTSQGLINLNIGSVEDLGSVDWTSDEYFIEISVNGTVIGTNQLLSVPYALHAKTAENLTGAISETDPVFSVSEASNITATDIINLSNLSGSNTGDQDISGIAINATAITSIQGEQTTQDAAIALNTAKTGMTIAQSDAILANSGKDTLGIYHANRTALDVVSGTNTGDQTLTTILTGNTSAGSNKITELADPTAEQDAATKAYVDAFMQQLSSKGVIVIDVDGNIYSTVRIGSQLWMAENLKTTKYTDGTDIPLVTDITDWGNLTTPAYCWYDNNQVTYGNTYGALYNWYVVETGNVCPTGWHIPTDAEWTILTDYLEGTSVAGGKLKETGTTHWVSPNTGATNETGFTALPGGYRYHNGVFNSIGIFGCWWSATEYDASTAWYRYLSYSSSSVLRDDDDKKIGFSVRCLRD